MVKLAPKHTVVGLLMQKHQGFKSAHCGNPEEQPKHQQQHQRYQHHQQQLEAVLPTVRWL